MWKWLVRGLVSGLALLVALVVAWFMMVQAANADAEPVPRELARASFKRSVAWLLSHEQQVLGDGNAALWWMVQTAAERSGDPDLHRLVKRSIELAYAGPNATSPWRRLVEPQARIEPRDSLIDGLEPYQRFYYYAATCRPVEPDSQGMGSQRFLASNVCQPMWRKVLLADNVCTTHQLLGIRMARRSGCPMGPQVAALEAELLHDIAWQLKLDPVFRDAYIQRVLTMYWVAGPQYVKPVWLRRVLDAQRTDGGWSGDRALPELPDWLQPAMFRRWAGAIWPARFGAAAPVSEFHPTAQALLLMALAMQADQVQP